MDIWPKNRFVWKGGQANTKRDSKGKYSNEISSDLSNKKIDSNIHSMVMRPHKNIAL